MICSGKSNIEKQLRIKGEYSNPEQEQLFDWIQKETKPGLSPAVDLAGRDHREE